MEAAQADGQISEPEREQLRRLLCARGLLDWQATKVQDSKVFRLAKSNPLGIWDRTKWIKELSSKEQVIAVYGVLVVSTGVRLFVLFTG